jgi:hypothetical protein
VSFILDALRKSENDRQRQASPNVSVTATGSNRGWQPGWIALALTGVGAALLAVTIVWWFLAPTTTATKNSAAAVSQPSPSAGSTEPGVRNLAQEARRNTTEVSAEPTSSASLRDAVSTPPPAIPSSRGDVPLTVTEAMASGISLPSLNLDIHVFAPQPTERFVFINARKYRENEQLREGPTVKEITSDGVILTFQGKRLLLPRD